MDAPSPARNLAQTLISVTLPVYMAEMRRVVNNFDPHLDAEIANAIINDNYTTVFYVVAGGELDEYNSPPDDELFRLVVNTMLQTQRERGMPRVAQWRALAGEAVEADASLRRGREIVERERAAEQAIRDRRDGR